MAEDEEFLWRVRFHTEDEVPEFMKEPVGSGHWTRDKFATRADAVAFIMRRMMGNINEQNRILCEFTRRL